MNVKAGITTTAAKAAREGFEGAYSDAHAGEDTRSNIVRAKGGFTTTEEAAAREGFEGAYGSEWEGLAPCGTRRVDGVSAEALLSEESALAAPRPTGEEELHAAVMAATAGWGEAPKHRPSFGRPCSTSVHQQRASGCQR